MVETDCKPQKVEISRHLSAPRLSDNTYTLTTNMEGGWVQGRWPERYTGGSKYDISGDKGQCLLNIFPLNNAERERNRRQCGRYQWGGHHVVAENHGVGR